MTRRAKLGGGVMVLAAIAAALVWWHARDAAHPAMRADGDRAADVATTAAAIRTFVDPRTLRRGSIAGTIRDDHGAPIAGARVCTSMSTAELPDDVPHEPSCAVSDTRGGYALGPLLAAQYWVQASAPIFRPASYREHGSGMFRLGAGERKLGVDLVLRAGGAEITGTVSDLGGGPISHAWVESGGWRGPPVETDDRGRFSLWTDPGEAWITASADGYDDGDASVTAPEHVDLVLTPESTLAGTVVDADGRPVGGARVDLEPSAWLGIGRSRRATTDDTGAFHANKLAPGRVVVIARTDSAYGRSVGSIGLGFAQHVDGVVVRMFPAARVTGRVISSDPARPCTAGYVTLEDRASTQRATSTAAGGGVVVTPVLRGTYESRPSCDGFVARDRYPTIAVGDKDVTGVEWIVDPGATLRVRVVDRRGTPIEAAEVGAGSATPGSSNVMMSYATGRDGRAEITGLRPGAYTVTVDSHDGIAPADGFPVQVAAGVTEQQVVLDDAGTITGEVVDETGAPAAHVRVVLINGADGESVQGPVSAHTDGTFELRGIRPGAYRVREFRSWTTDTDVRLARGGAPVEVKPGQASHVHLVVPARRGTISGLIVDADGAPVGDAFVSSAREAGNAAVYDTRDTIDAAPLLTSPDGAFTLTGLDAGAYTLRAERRGGGGEAIAQHVSPGDHPRLQLLRTGSIAGTVRVGGAAPDVLAIAVLERTTGLRRTEQLYKSGGDYTIAELPAGTYQLQAIGDGATASTTVELAAGERKQGVDLALVAMVTITAHVVDAITGQPMPGVRVYAEPLAGTSVGLPSRAAISDDTGGVTLANIPAGAVRVMAYPIGDPPAYDHGYFTRTIAPGASGAVDLGALPLVKRRLASDQRAGALGLSLTYASSADSDPPPLAVTAIDPRGPAAALDVRVGDVITAIDGADVTAGNAVNGRGLLAAPAGTSIALTLARGPTIRVVLAGL